MAEILDANLEFVDNLKRALVWGQTSLSTLTTANPALLGGDAYMPASDIFVLNFERAITTGQITLAQISNPSTISNLGTNSPVDQAFVDECTRAGIFQQVVGFLGS